MYVRYVCIQCKLQYTKVPIFKTTYIQIAYIVPYSPQLSVQHQHNLLWHIYICTVQTMLRYTYTVCTGCTGTYVLRANNQFQLNQGGGCKVYGHVISIHRQQHSQLLSPSNSISAQCLWTLSRSSYPLYGTGVPLETYVSNNSMVTAVMHSCCKLTHSFVV